jgi:hypothetical protein
LERHVRERESDRNWKFEFKQGKKYFIDESKEFLKMKMILERNTKSTCNSCPPSIALVQFY